MGGSRQEGEQAMNDIAKFYAAKKTADDNEEIIIKAKAALADAYAELVYLCPHSEAIDWKYGGSAVFRVCMICGVIDMASQGGTTGDEYNYGYAGHPHREFWKNSKIMEAKSENEHWSYRNRNHEYIVKGGKVVNRFD